MNKQLAIVSGPEKGRVFLWRMVKRWSSGVANKVIRRSMTRTCRECTAKSRWTRTKLSWPIAEARTRLVRGTAVDEYTLQPGDEFQAGSSVFRFTIGDISDDETKRTTAPVVGAAAKKTLALKDLVGQTLGNYRLDKIIAAGNSGYLFKATDTEKDRVAAVKVLSPDRTSTDEEKERFVRAMKTMLPIRHSNIVPLWNAGKSGPFCWAAMEFIDCESMTEVIHRIGIDGMIDWRDAWRVAVDIASALERRFYRK